jgi:hypothetical protein
MVLLNRSVRKPLPSSAARMKSYSIGLLSMRSSVTLSGSAGVACGRAIRALSSVSVSGETDSSGRGSVGVRSFASHVWLRPSETTFCARPPACPKTRRCSSVCSTVGA